MIGGRIDTGVAPMAAIRVPKPMLISSTCTTLSCGETVFISVTTRAMAPLSSITVTWKIEVATISEMGKEATMPLRLAFRVTASGVWKKSQAMTTAASQPRAPEMSAAFLATTSSRNIRITGSRARNTARPFMVELL